MSHRNGAETAPDASRAPTRALRAISVLVIDDDRETSEMLSRLLRKAGYSVRTAGDGREALDLLRWVRPAIIFLDIHMPVMDGAQFREAQRRESTWIEIPTVVITADSAVEPLLDLAVEKTLRKPFKIDEILAIVERHCGPGTT